jgi:hypothetical protein
MYTCTVPEWSTPWSIKAFDITTLHNMLCDDVFLDILRHVVLLGHHGTILSVLLTCKWVHRQISTNARFLTVKQEAVNAWLRRMTYRPDQHDLFRILKCREGDEDYVEDGIQVFAVFPDWAQVASQIVPVEQNTRQPARRQPHMVDEDGWTLVSTKRRPVLRPPTVLRRPLLHRPPLPDMGWRTLPSVHGGQIHIFLVFPHPEVSMDWNHHSTEIAALYKWDWHGTAQELYQLLLAEDDCRDSDVESEVEKRFEIPRRFRRMSDWEDQYLKFAETFLAWYEGGRMMPPLSDSTYSCVEEITFRRHRVEDDMADDPSEQPLWAQRKGHAFFYW